MQPRTAIVVQKGDHSVGFYELGGGREVARVALDRYPHEMALSRDRTLALVTHFGVALAEDEGDGGNTVSVVDVVQRKRVAVIDCEDSSALNRRNNFSSRSTFAASPRPR